MVAKVISFFIVLSNTNGKHKKLKLKEIQNSSDNLKMRVCYYEEKQLLNQSENCLVSMINMKCFTRGFFISAA